MQPIKKVADVKIVKSSSQCEEFISVQSVIAHDNGRVLMTGVQTTHFVLCRINDRRWSRYSVVDLSAVTSL